MELFFKLNSITISSKLEFRIKKENSVEQKLDNYLRKAQKGKVPMSKTLNDLFGLRLIAEETTHHEINDFIASNFENLKCIDSSKGDYKATHIYFNYNNNTFQWELQVWSKENETSNKTSHSKYKQSYTIWEDEMSEKE